MLNAAFQIYCLPLQIYQRDIQIIENSKFDFIMIWSQLTLLLSSHCILGGGERIVYSQIYNEQFFVCNLVDIFELAN